MEKIEERYCTCARCGLREQYNGDWYGSLCPSCADETETEGTEGTATCRQFKLSVPTCGAQFVPEQVEDAEVDGFDDAKVPILVREDEGLHIVLGTHDFEMVEKPDILIERHPHGWLIVVHPNADCDPVGRIYLLDNGRTYFVKGPVSAQIPIKVLEWATFLRKTGARKRERPIRRDWLEADDAQ